MSSMKDFLELVSKDQSVKLELAEGSLKALSALLNEKGLSDEAVEALKAATQTVAEAHGFKPSEMEELSKEELEAVAGGFCWAWDSFWEGVKDFWKKGKETEEVLGPALDFICNVASVV